MNRTQHIGNLGQAAELKHTSDGKSYCRFSIAVNKTWTDKKSGEKKESTLWVPVSIWGRQAEYLAPKLVKGAKVFVEGELKIGKYVDKKDGVEKQSVEVQANIVQVLASNPKAEESHGSDED